jgi:hypothetical protein
MTAAIIEAAKVIAWALLAVAAASLFWEMTRRRKP